MPLKSVETSPSHKYISSPGVTLVVDVNQCLEGVKSSNILSILKSSSCYPNDILPECADSYHDALLTEKQRKSERGMPLPRGPPLCMSFPTRLHFTCGYHFTQSVILHAVTAFSFLYLQLSVSEMVSVIRVRRSV